MEEGGRFRESEEGRGGFNEGERRLPGRWFRGGDHVMVSAWMLPPVPSTAVPVFA